MQSLAHRQLVRKIRALDQKPSQADASAAWLRAEEHLQLLRESAMAGEVILFAYTPLVTWIHTVLEAECSTGHAHAVSRFASYPRPYQSRAFYSVAFGSSLGEGDVQLDLAFIPFGSSSDSKSINLLFLRDIEGLTDDEPAHHELLQEFAQASGILWFPEQHAYCRLDRNGDIDPVVSVTQCDDLTLFTCNREPLEQFAATTGLVLTTYFELNPRIDRLPFGLDYDPWVDYSNLHAGMSFSQHLAPGKASFTRGLQVVKPTAPREEILRSISSPWHDWNNREYADFIVHDVIQGKAISVSSAPNEQGERGWPYDLCLACFNPEVLERYKADPQKYTVDQLGRSVSCRGTWELRRWTVNDAGQVMAYLCYLRDLPFEEQQYWKIFNEEPLAGIPPSVFRTDFEALVPEDVSPLERLVMLMHKWNQADFEWWSAPTRRSIRILGTPLTDSQAAWGQAFSTLAKVVVEGFKTRVLKATLKERQIGYQNEERSLKLLERLIAARSCDGETLTLSALREAQNIRTKISSHKGGTEADAVAKDALAQHGTYAFHFHFVCERIVDELESIESVLTE